MKILAVRGKNLASLEEKFEIDFTVEPLKSAGIFAITGQTGSGKSTLLDAICLALFNDTPRINRAADNADIIDVKDLTIKQKDCRNILRRGTADGYAEVDFLSLAGDKYRVRWSVRRSRDKIDGSLQNATYQVFNLPSNSELQGGKTELLAKVKELIGLTFEQFTRAVLLAQGDFATFLKATPKEKAELLEKLTETDIYSRISAKIYENTKQAETELLHITERIKDVELLTDEQISVLTIEKESGISATNLLEVELKTLNDKLQWLHTYQQLIDNIANAEIVLVNSTSAITEAKSRFDELERIESVQAIRDSFNQFQHDKKQLVADEMLLKEQQALNIINQESLSKIKEEYISFQHHQNQLMGEWQTVELQMKEARKLEIQIEEMVKNITAAEKEVSQIVEQKNQYEKNMEGYETQIITVRQSQQKSKKWLEDNAIYADIVTKIDLIISYIFDTYSVEQQIHRNEKLLTQIKELLDQEEQQLDNQQQEVKRLNDILPTEIVNLRKKLKEQEPCPVCGSTHHPISQVNVESLEELTLNKVKTRVTHQIERLTQSITQRHHEIIRLQSLITNYQEQYDITFVKLTEAVNILPEWQIQYKEGKIIDELKNINQQWKYNTNEQNHQNEQLTILHQDFKTVKERLLEFTDRLAEKQQKHTVMKDELTNLNQQYQKLLNGKTADDVEKEYLKQFKEVESQIIQTNELQNNLTGKKEKIVGIMTQLSDNILRLENRVGELEGVITHFLSTRKDNLTQESLANLLSQDNLWITAERALLDKLCKTEWSSRTTLAERKRVMEEHQKVTVKPVDDETYNLLNATLNEKTQQLHQKRERISEIGMLLTHHQKGKERIQEFEKERTQKEMMTENWRKLNELLGSADGTKFKILAQGYTLDVLLGYANKHLKEIAPRYLLERVSTDSLSLQVIDLDMLSEVRSVHSLSGGESFLISLALALGLSSLSSNKMRIESLFIDEGFGTLDANTLRVAMAALETLQTQGRKIGVISHVAEMTEQISTQIRVIKTSNGRSHVEVSGM